MAEWMRVLFIGSGDIGVPTLEALLNSQYEIVGVVSQPDKPVGREQQIEPPPVKKAVIRSGRFLAAEQSSAARKPPPPILQPARIKDPQAIEHIRALKPDVIVVIAYGQILPREVLEIPGIACLNMHASLLPRWRGAAPIQAAIAAADRETGITVMYMDEGLDTGDILLQRKIEIQSDDTGGSLHDRLARIAPEVLFEALDVLANRTASRIPQDQTHVTYAPKLKREDGGIDWREPADVIERKIRAFNPWPGAFMNLHGRTLKIFLASIVDRSGNPGEILDSKHELIVAAGKGALSLRELQLQGKRRMNAAEFLRGYTPIVRATG